MKGFNVVAHFNIEKKQKIEISIPGYDPTRETQKMKERLQKNWSKDRQQRSAKKKSAQAPASNPLPTKPHKVDATLDEDIAALNSSLAMANVFQSDTTDLPDNIFVDAVHNPAAIQKGSA